MYRGPEKEGALSGDRCGGGWARGTAGGGAPCRKGRFQWERAWPRPPGGQPEAHASSSTYRGHARALMHAPHSSTHACTRLTRLTLTHTRPGTSYLQRCPAATAADRPAPAHDARFAGDRRTQAVEPQLGHPAAGPSNRWRGTGSRPARLAHLDILSPAAAVGRCAGTGGTLAVRATAGLVQLWPGSPGGQGEVTAMVTAAASRPADVTAESSTEWLSLSRRAPGAALACVLPATHCPPIAHCLRFTAQRSLPAAACCHRRALALCRLLALLPVKLASELASPPL